MKQSSKVALCGIIAALASSLMLCAYFPHLTYGIPALAGILFIVPTIEINWKWAIRSYIVASLITFFVAEKEAMVLFVLFFGYYPILKGKIESINRPAVEYILKFAIFNIAILIAYCVIIFLFKIPVGEMGVLGIYAIVVLIAAANLVFFIFDIAVSRVVSVYMNVLHHRIRRMFKQK